ncbi:MAG: prepilin-type N-terminal cleavage/methylation domain-containing protein [Candidatus Zixiibacteriota bacterium]|nr:MAG: prepilin-type N-terminal cleavage/methylation domain-containing protein [candidate division Zixibacteria bacterium]
MKTLKPDRFRSSRGFTILEVLIAGLITAILATASFRFYTSMHNQTETQYEVSEVQHQCRASVNDIKKTLRQAGFKLVGHPAAEMNGDSLAVYFSETQPVDTVLYYLEEFNDHDYWRVPDLPEGQKLYKLMKRRNSSTPEIYTDYIVDIDFTQVDTRTMLITVTAQVSKKDDSFQENGGFRTWTLDEQVTLRNVTI